MTFTVLYGRYGGRYTKEFDSISAAWAWIEREEDEGQIFAAEISEGERVLFKSRHPLSEPRWVTGEAARILSEEGR